jgi:two-component sensor histidine kinase
MTEANFDTRFLGSGKDAVSLIDLFSPARKPGSPVRYAGENERLWAKDAIHRANNLAQLATSLSRIDLTRIGLSPADHLGPEARQLAAAYATLGESELRTTRLDCAPLLEEIATALVSLFAGSSSVRLRFAADSIALDEVRRRALILIASELVINALKYAFPHGRAGQIFISLTTVDEAGELVVLDDGIGLSGMEQAGAGSGLIMAMSGLLGGRVERISAPGRGARFSIMFPLQSYGEGAWADGRHGSPEGPASSISHAAVGHQALQNVPFELSGEQ